MENSSGVGKSGKADFQVKKTIEFFSTPFTSLRAELLTISDKPYIAIAKFWKPEDSDEFVPTKKSIFLTFEQWFALEKKTAEITKSFATFVGTGLGILYLFYFNNVFT